MLYAILAAMLCVAALVVALPLLRQERRLTAKSASAIVVVLLISVSLYSRIGMPDADPGAPDQMPDVASMVASLAARLQQNPDDLNGWKMLGRSYVQLEDFPAAVGAYERAVEIEAGRDAQTLADLGEVLLLTDRAALHGRAGELFDSALAIVPDNPKALFYAGMAAIQRGDKELGATYWQTLLASSPPENIQAILRPQIAELRGTAPPASAVTVMVSLGEAAAGVARDATVFVIVRDPAQPSPPIAAVRRKASELPAEVMIGDADAMIPGRVPSGFAQLEIVARVSLSGEPVAQSGDWFGQQIISTGNSAAVTIVIDQQVP